LATELAAGGVDLVAAGMADVGDDRMFAQDLDKLFESAGGGALVGDAAEGGTDGVVGDDIDVCSKAFHEACEPAGMVGRVIHFIEQAILDIDESAGALLVAFGGGHDLVDVIAAVHGDQPGAGEVIGGV